MAELVEMRQRLAVSARLQDLAERVVVARGDRPEALLEAAEFAGGLIWNSHGGRFALPGVEDALRSLRLAPRAGEGTEVVGRTLHVITEAYPVGGHTRLVRRWIEWMEDDRHAVVLVRQRTPFDREWVAPDGADVPVVDLLRSEGLSRRGRAERLAGLMARSRRVILHIHPDDAVSVAAAHQVAGADLHFLNHADHVAWLGAALPATMLNLRKAGVRLAELRRGIPDAGGEVVPIPIPPQVRMPRAEARATLGIGDHDVLLLTIATGYKYLPVEGRSLEAALAGALTRPEVRLMAIGPDPDHPVFGRLAERFPGRVHALGVRSDTACHRCAADLYLDSYPFCSPTSMLESAALGTPVLSLQPDPETFGVLYSECPGLPRESYAAPDEGGYQRLLGDLLGSASVREARSAQILAGMVVHGREAWRRVLQAHLERRTPRPHWEGNPVPREAGDLDAVLAGLGVDPLRQPKLKRWRALGPRGPLAVLRERLLAGLRRTGGGSTDAVTLK